MILRGFASLPADTFAEGPPAGEGISANGRTGPFPGQPVQGFSGVQFAPSGGGDFLFLSDNGFGNRDNSSDYLLRIYQIDPDFVGAEEGDGSVAIESFIQLADPNDVIPFEIVNEGTEARRLTGSDFDIESFVIDGSGDIWVGDEFGPFVLHFDSEGTLLEAPIETPNIFELDTLNGQIPIVIGHRGASGERPEHTLEAYELAIEQGADFIEPDLVPTRDGVLIARHENALATVQLDENNEIVLDENGNPIITQETTNVAEIEEFSDRLTVKFIDGEAFGGWFSEDFTLEEIKQLRARERIPGIRPQNTEFNDQFEVPTLAEVIDLVREVEAETGREIGIYPETKHPTFFAEEGTFLNGDPINISLSQQLIDTLVAEDFTDPDRIFIQSFEIENLLRLQNEIMPAAGVDIPLVQLTGDFEEQFINENGGGFSIPYDVAYNFSDVPGANPEVYDGFPIEINAETDYGDLANAETLEFISEAYAEGLGPWKNSFLLREPLDEPIDGNGDGEAEITTQLTGEVFPLIDLAHDAGLLVHPYTLRVEETFLTANPDGSPQTLEEEVEQIIGLGADGFFIDNPGIGDNVRDAITAPVVRSPQNPEVLFGDAEANLPSSRGYEGMAFSPDRTTAYPMLEGPVTGDPDNSRRIYEFDLESGEFSGLVGFYGTADPNHAIGDFTPINETEFLVIERDGGQAENAEFKKVFKIDISEIDEEGFVAKEEVVDLLNIEDPDDLNGDGDTTFAFPFVTIEDVLVIDEDTILVANDNNYPFSVGRPPEIDNNEIILVELAEPLDLDPRLGIDGVLPPDTPETPEGFGVLEQLNTFATGFIDDETPLTIPSTDSSGVAFYNPDNTLFIADSEIAELEIFPDTISVNLFQTSLDGQTLIRAFDLTDEEVTGAVNDEPTGITYDPVADRFYISNDNTLSIFRYQFVQEGDEATFVVEDEITLEDLPEDLPGVTGDFEGVTIDPESGLIYSVDGTGQAIVVLNYDEGFEFVDSFLINPPGETIVSDPEGIAFDPLSGNLFLVSEVDGIIAEFTVSGEFVQDYPLDPLSPPQIAAQGLTFAPPSENPEADPTSLYIADARVDNNDDPDERDGRIYEVDPQVVPRPTLNFGSPEDDVIEPQGREFVFAGGGDDLVDGSLGEGNNRFYGSSGDDELFADEGDRLFGGAGNDTLDATLGGGDNRLYGGDGADDFFAGAGDRLIGDAGDDRFFIVEGGDNVLTGGDGADQFWIANAQLPTSNTITDFTDGEDVLGIAGLGVSFEDLEFSSGEGGDTAISLQGQEIALVLGIDDLVEANFAFAETAFG